MLRRGLLCASAASVILLMTSAAFADPMADAQAVVDKYASPAATWDGPTTGPKAAEGKVIVVLAGDLKNGGILGVTTGVQEAAAAIGWEVKVSGRRRFDQWPHGRLWAGHGAQPDRYHHQRLRRG